MEHYYSQSPSAVSKEKKIIVNILNKDFVFITDAGVFSKNRLDQGTKLLLEQFSFNKQKTALDLGCGYGPIGIILTACYNIKFDMVDINERSLKLSEKNTKINAVTTAVYGSDGFKNITKKFDSIITNPPMRVGKKKVLALLKEAKKFLNKDGELWFVINRKQGSKSIYKALANDYQIEIVKKSNGFWIFRALSN